MKFTKYKIKVKVFMQRYTKEPIKITEIAFYFKNRE